MFLFRSVRNWLTLLFLVLIAAASAVSWVYVVPPLRDRLVQQKLDNLVAQIDLFTAGMEQEPAVLVNDDGTLKFEEARLVRRAYAVDPQIDARITVFRSADLKVISGQSELENIADSRLPALAAADYPMVADAASTQEVAFGLAKLRKNEYATVAVPVKIETAERTPLGVAAIVLMSSSLRDVDSAVALVERQILLATALALGVTLVASFLASLLIARRLKRIERGAEAIAGGDFGVTLRVRVRDEIGQLAQSFNAMGARLRQAFGAIEQEKQSAETMLDTLDEGVIGMSAEGRVLMHNPAAARFLGRRLTVGAAAESAFPEEVLRLWTELRFSPQEEPIVFELRGRTLEALTSPVGAGTDLDSIIVLRDITQQARLERSRRDFVANASHEFKTPLFSLSGFLELLDEEGNEEEERREYLELMKEQVERLQALSHSLLDLSQVDAGAVHLYAAPVDVAALCRSVLAEFQGRAAERRLHVTMDAPSGVVVAVCDDERLAQVLRALLDNAMKFTDEGGQVALSVTADSMMARIAISDTGAGIPASELPRIFDRFYRGNLTRGTRAGTGLGLSIARDLTQLMGGGITATSRPGQGSCFVVSLPFDGTVITVEA